MTHQKNSSHSWGLRQGDPLSPFLFSLVADGISAISKNAKRVGLIGGFRVRDGRHVVSHLQFADDMILFIEAEEKYIRNMDSCLKNFELISGLKINMSKSCMVGCRVDQWSIKYLGLLLGGLPRCISFWDPIVEKVSKKLSC